MEYHPSPGFLLSDQHYFALQYPYHHYPYPGFPYHPGYVVHYPGYQQFPVPGVQFTQFTYTASVYALSSSVPPLPPTHQDDSTNTNSAEVTDPIPTRPGRKNLHQGISKSATKTTKKETSSYKKLKTTPETDISTGKRNVSDDVVYTSDDTFDPNKNINNIFDIKPEGEVDFSTTAVRVTDNWNESDNILMQNIAHPIIETKVKVEKTVDSADEKKKKKKNLTKKRNKKEKNLTKKKTKKEKTPRQVPLSFPCKTCKETFTVKSKLYTHIRKAHRKFECNICGRHLANLGAKKEHISRHTGERPFICQHCGKDFRARKTLQNHEKLHTGEKPFQCGVCQQKFVQRTGLNYHMRTWNHLENTDFGLNTVANAQMLQLGGKTSRDPVKTHSMECRYCGKVYRRKKPLENHERLHSEENLITRERRQ